MLIYKSLCFQKKKIILCTAPRDSLDWCQEPGAQLKSLTQLVVFGVFESWDCCFSRFLSRNLESEADPASKLRLQMCAALDTSSITNTDDFWHHGKSLHTGSTFHKENESYFVLHTFYLLMIQEKKGQTLV